MRTLENVVFLETVLETLAPKCNVLVCLSSQTIYGLGETDKPIVSQDHCGNHYVDNWLTAINSNLELKRYFVIDNIEVEKTCDGDLQYRINLVNGKDKYTEMLRHDSNAAACAQIFHF